MGLDVKPHGHAVDAKAVTSPFQPRRRNTLALSKVALPEGKERHDADRDQQLRQEDGVDLRGGGTRCQNSAVKVTCVPHLGDSRTFLMKVCLMVLSSQANWASMSS